MRESAPCERACATLYDLSPPRCRLRPTSPSVLTWARLRPRNPEAYEDGNARPEDDARGDRTDRRPFRPETLPDHDRPSSRRALRVHAGLRRRREPRWLPRLDRRGAQEQLPPPDHEPRH